MSNVVRSPWIVGTALAVALLCLGGASSRAAAATTVQVGNVTVNVTTEPGTAEAGIDTIVKIIDGAAKVFDAAVGWLGGHSGGGGKGSGGDKSGGTHNCNININVTIKGGTQVGNVNVGNLNCGGTQSGNSSSGSPQ